MKLSTNNGNPLDVDNQSSESLSTSIYNTGNIFTGNDFESRLLFCKKKVIQLKCDGCKVAIAVPIRCKSRFCVDCAKYLSRRTQKVLIGIIKERDLYPKKYLLKFNTLTCLNFPGSRLKDGFDSMTRWFSRLLRRKITSRVIKDTIEHVTSNPELLAKMEKRYQKNGGWELVFWNFKGKAFNKLFTGGLKRFEVTKGLDGNYHLHIHNFYEGGFIPQPILNQVWSDIVSKDGWKAEVTDIRAVKNVRKGVKEIAKYAFKPDSLTMDDKIFLDGVFQNRRLYSFYGEWFALLGPGVIDYLIDEEPLTCPCCNGRSFTWEGGMMVVDMSDRWIWDEDRGVWLFFTDEALRNQGWSTFYELDENVCNHECCSCF